MKVLFLGKQDSPLITWLKSYGEDVVQWSEKLPDNDDFLKQFQFLISYNYRYIISGKILNAFPNRAINLHISLLPWNRGADPNLWSFFENTPSGITIHYIDVGLDTGDIIYQKEIEFSDNEKTLASTYERLHKELQTVFMQHWAEIRIGKCPKHRQPAHYGTYHKLKDKEPYAEALNHSWSTSTEHLKKYGIKKNLRGLS